LIGGMISSTLLTLVVPAAYSLVESGLARLQRGRAGRTAHA
jgi:Cu/Ag efflux pump CusA